LIEFDRVGAVKENPSFSSRKGVWRGVTPVRLERTANGLKVLWRGCVTANIQQLTGSRKIGMPPVSSKSTSTAPFS